MIRYRKGECTVSLDAEFFFIFLELNLFLFEWLLKPKCKIDLFKMIIFSFISLNIEIFLMIFLLYYFRSNFDYYDCIYKCLIAFVCVSVLSLSCIKKFPYWEDEPELNIGDNE